MVKRSIMLIHLACSMKTNNRKKWTQNLCKPPKMLIGFRIKILKRGGENKKTSPFRNWFLRSRADSTIILKISEIKITCITIG